MVDLETLLHRGVVEIIVEEELRQRLAAGRLRIKVGFDPSKPDLHLGHAAGLRKLRQFQEVGHEVVLVVGDWTAQIGDPSGRDESRTMLTPAEVQVNAQTYMDQFFLIVDKTRTEVRWQSEWYSKFTLGEVFNLTSRFTLADMMEHETFDRRWKENHPITLMELMYPLLQGYDSVAVRADVEGGGTDQKFNNLAGRQLQPAFGQRGQCVLLWPLLIGTDGRKMSKSFGNTVDLKDTPEEMYGKIMSMADTVLADYLVCLTDIPLNEIRDWLQQMQQGRLNPRDVKMRLAREIITQLHGDKAAREAEEGFVRVFQRRELPEKIPAFVLTAPMPIVDLLVASGLAASKGEARRLVTQGGVQVRGERVTDANAPVPTEPGLVVQVGKRRFLRIVVPA